jgi:FtsH-binding integral membrane protein
MENVFKRTEADSQGAIISANVYNLVIGLTLCWGFLVNWLMVKNIPYESVASIHPLLFFVGYLASCFFGVYLYTKSSNPVISFMGYNFVVVPFGLVINRVVYFYDPAVVLSAVKVTGLATAAMMILGTLYPAFFMRIARALFIGLIVVIIVEAVEIFLLKIHHGFLDWIVALIFCGYIGVDWGRANSIPKTIDNAIDSAAALYMDIIILFLRILSIMGRRR